MRRGGHRFVGRPSAYSNVLATKSPRANWRRPRAYPSLRRKQTDPDVKMRALAAKLGYPVMLKAAKGGGGRGMRVVASEKELPDALVQAQREARTAFGSSDVFLEKFVARARHLEVQLLGDVHGNLVHLHERDCSLQRRHQKVIEIAPAPNLPAEVRENLCDAALAIGRSVGYVGAGTVEFLLDVDQ